MQEGPPQGHVATDSGERNQGDGEDLGRHQAYGKGSADVEGACCCPTCHLGVKGMSESVYASAKENMHQFKQSQATLGFNICLP